MATDKHTPLLEGMPPGTPLCDHGCCARVTPADLPQGESPEPRPLTNHQRENVARAVRDLLQRSMLPEVAAQYVGPLCKDLLRYEATVRALEERLAAKPQEKQSAFNDER